jgi:hypothetical protein
MISLHFMVGPFLRGRYPPFVPCDISRFCNLSIFLERGTPAGRAAGRQT